MASEKSASGFSLKDELFNQERVNFLARLFHDSDSAFDKAGFVKATMRKLKKLELKERIVHIASTLEGYLDEDFKIAAKQIVAALPPPLDPKRRDDDFGDFIFASLGEFVVRNGMEKHNLKLALKTLKALTQRFSMEDAIRAFLNEHTAESLRELEKWTLDKNYHVRRLVSEGTRPFLPWSKRVQIGASETLPFLDALHADSTRYVTRSVANHLNDIAKNDPDVVIRTLKDWRKQGKQDAKELQWMCKHALRTLVKQGHPQSLRLLGFRLDPKIQIDEFKIHCATLKPGERLEFSFAISAARDEELMVDYVIDFVKSNGKLAPKVHKLKQLQLGKGHSTTLTKRHLLHASATTYTLYPGTHYLTLQINGKAFGRQAFELK